MRGRVSRQNTVQHLGIKSSPNSGSCLCAELLTNDGAAKCLERGAGCGKMQGAVLAHHFRQSWRCDFHMSNNLFVLSVHGSKFLIFAQMGKSAWLWVLLASLACWTVLSLGTGCKRNVFSEDPNLALRFSADTILFDTVFATIGSVTLPLKVYNPNDDAVRISEIVLESGPSSAFRINADGMSGLEFEDLPLLPGDSLWIFVEVTVDPTNDDTPFVVEDGIRFVTNGNEQRVQLAAWGANAFFHGGASDGFTSLPCDDVWTPALPHVIYGIVEVDAGCTLTVLPGTEVYVHSGGGLLVYQSTLNALGTLENPIVFQGDRLHDGYADLAGSWGIEFQVDFGPESELFTVARGGIWLYGSIDSKMNHVHLRNGTIGLQVDTVGAPNVPSLTMTNSIISNMSGIGMLAQGAKIDGYNNLIYDCGQMCGAFTLGGTYRMDHCTFANYWSDGVRQAPAVLLNDWYQALDGSNQIRSLEGSRFNNCIIWGNNATLDDFDELVADLANPPASPLITQSAVDVQDEDFQFDLLLDCTTDAAPPFANTPDRDFHLTGNNSLWEGGNAQFPIATDLDGLPRVVGLPDKGCYERQ